MLSAQTTDVNVNRVTETLFEKYRRPEDYLAVPLEELEHDIRATGFFRQKTKSLRGTMKMLIEEFDGEVPRTLEELDAAAGRRPQDRERRRLRARRDPGRRRRHARPPAVAASGADAPGRPGEDRARLQRLVPREDWGVFPHLLIWHGRRVCIARRPRCESACSRTSVRRVVFKEIGTRRGAGCPRPLFAFVRVATLDEESVHVSRPLPSSARR